MVSNKPIATYSGDTFRNSIRQYSFDRMARDPQYRKDVRKAKAVNKTFKTPQKDPAQDVAGL